VQESDSFNINAPLGSLTSYYVRRVFASVISSQVLWTPLIHTFEIAIGAILIALLVGGSMAYLLSRTNMFGRRWFSTALIVPYMLPSWTFALAWTTLFKNRTVGGTAGWLEALGFAPPNWLAYGQFPITIVLGLHYAPFVILLFGNALRRFDSQLEDSAQILGARRFTVMTKITIPLLRPALLSAITLILAKCVGDFGVTYVLGVPTNYNVLATSLYRMITSGQVGTGAVLAGAIILIGALALLVDARLVRESRRFVTIGAKGAMDRAVLLRAWRMPATISAGILFVVSVAIPVLTLFLSTIMAHPGKFTASNFTLAYWIGHDLPTVGMRQGVLITPDFWQAAWNTLWIVGVSALAAGILGILVGYVVVRTPVRPVGAFLKWVTFFPYLVPGVAFAVAYISLFAVPRGPIPALYGTVGILIVALVAEQMPFASRSGISAMMQLGKDPEEAAQIAGAGWWRRMRLVVLPIQRGPVTTGVLLPFISGVKGLSLVILLVVPGMDLLTTYAIRLVEFGYLQSANAVVLMVAALAFFGTLIGQKITKSNLSDGLGG